MTGIDNYPTIFPLKLTYAQKDMMVDIARTQGVNVDKPEALNAWIIRTLGVDI